MLRMSSLSVALSAGLAPAAFAEGCMLEGGASVPVIEAMNQLILELKVDDFARGMEEMANMNLDGAMKSVGEVYAAGFDSCATLLQRKDVGGLTQQLVMFRSKVGPLFLYWMYFGSGEDFTLLQFKLDSDLDVLDNLR